MTQVHFEATVAKIPCCVCGVPIDPNPSSMCINCLREKCNFTEEVPNSSSIVYCKSCGRYQTNPTTWVHAELESPELLQICLKKVTGIKNMKVIDAQFLYTEPHSRRIRISLTLQKEAFNNTTLRQTLIVTFVVTYMQCPQCCEEATPRDHWMCCVQLRQGIDHKRTLFWLEQQILSNRAHLSCCSIERVHDGMDFHFTDVPTGRKFANFLKSKVPAHTHEYGKLVGEDIQSSIKDTRFSICVRCPPISRQDLVIIPPHLVQTVGNITKVAIVFRIGKNVKLVDPLTGSIVELDTNAYWKKEFPPLLTCKDLRKFVVLSIDNIGTPTGRFQIADVEITDEATYSERLLIRTHLGGVLKEGSFVLGYDLRANQFNEKDAEYLKNNQVPDIILVARTSSSEHKSRHRGYHLKELAPHNESDDEQFDKFLDDLEDDPELRENVTLYKDADGEVDPEVKASIAELGDLAIDDTPQQPYAFLPQAE